MGEVCEDSPLSLTAFHQKFYFYCLHLHYSTKMALNIVKMFGNNTSRMLSGCVRHSLSTRTVSSVVLPTSCRRVDVHRSFTRSLIPSCNYHAVNRPLTLSKKCGCCGLHTEGDREIVQFLDEEIKLEKSAEKGPGQVPTFRGFDVSTDGAEVSISKQADGETLTIKWNVNDSVADDEDPMIEEAEQAQEEDDQIASKPMFTIFVNKSGSGHSLALQCGFPQQEMPSHDGEPNIVDPLEIHEVAMVSGDDWNDKTYSVMGTVMDGDLYALLMNTLEDRGINQEFMNSLLDFSTHYEHKQYISFLQTLQEFARK